MKFENNKKSIRYIIIYILIHKTSVTLVIHVTDRQNNMFIFYVTF